jgi:type II secretory pathway component GspD/PulD (secretin)
VVSANPATHAVIREVLETLDELPQLIAVDITVSELRTPRSFTLGFGFSVPFSASNEVSGFVQSSPVPGGLPSEPPPGTSFFGRVARDTGVSFTLPGGGGVEIPIMQTGVVSAGDFTARTEVLIQPSLIVTAGEQHEIFVGDNVPVPVSDEPEIGDSTNTTIAALTQTTRFERTDIGIRLGVDAKAGREGKIQLKLDIDISSISPIQVGDVTQVGPTFISQTLEATARLDDGETAIIAISQDNVEDRVDSKVPWFSDIPFIGWLFTSNRDNSRDVRLVIAARASRISTPAELVADSIRRRLAFQRRNARDAKLPDADGPPFGVRVTTRTRGEDADAIAQGLAFRGHQTVIHEWSLSGDTFFDVYIVSLGSMAEAAELATVLSQDGWEADLVVLPSKRS